MTSDRPDSTDLLRALRATRRYALLLLVMCAAVIATGGLADEDPPPDPLASTLAISIGLGAIASRHLVSSRAIGPKAALYAGLTSIALSASLGLLGVYQAYALDAPRTGLLFAMAGAIFCARPAVR
jgi:hypothetical protein